VSLEYALDSEAEVGRFAALRMYHTESSSWGIYLGDVARGDEGVDSFDILPDEPGVPLTEGTELEVALVAGDDPYRTAPLSTASTTVGAESSGQQGAQPLDVRLIEPVAGTTVPPAEDLRVTVAVENENDVPAEATLSVAVGGSSRERTVVADEQATEEVEFTVSADALAEGEELTLVVSGENLASTVERAIVVAESSDSSESEDSTDESAEGERGDDSTDENDSDTTDENADGGGADSDETPTDSEGGDDGTDESATTKDDADTESVDSDDTQTAPEGENDGDTQSATGDGPGFGIVEAISGLGGVGYIIKNRLQGDDATDKTDS
jgi:hypothetical protein